MIALACAMLLASNCHAAPAPVEPVGYVVRARGLNAQAALAEVNAFRRRHGLKPVVLDQRLVQAAGTSARYQASRGRIGHRGPGRVEAVGSGKKRRLQPPPHGGERGLGAEILR